MMGPMPGSCLYPAKRMPRSVREEFDSLHARAKRLGYRLIRRKSDYLLWRVDWPSPIPSLGARSTLDEIAEQLDSIARSPRYQLDLTRRNTAINVTHEPHGITTVWIDEFPGNMFVLWPGECDGRKAIVHSSYQPHLGNWERIED